MHLAPTICFNQLRSISSATASITKVHRDVFTRLYPICIVLPDGSTISARHHEPQVIVKLPEDLSKLSDTERLARLEARRKSIKILIAKALPDNYDPWKYINMVKSQPLKTYSN